MTVRILEAFFGSPDGGRPRRFEAGEVYSDLPDDFALLIVTKGHAERVSETEAVAAKPSRAKKKAETLEALGSEDGSPD